MPDHYEQFIQRYPGVGSAYRALGEAAGVGPLDKKTIALIKLGMSIATNMEGATHSHTRKAVAAGATPDEIRHAILQAVTTLGFPSMMRGLAWVNDVLGPDD